MLPFGIVTPRVEMAFQGLGKIAGVTFANVENLPRAAAADDVCAGLVAERVQPFRKFTAGVKRRAIVQTFHCAPPF